MLALGRVRLRRGRSRFVLRRRYRPSTVAVVVVPLLVLGLLVVLLLNVDAALPPLR